MMSFTGDLADDAALVATDTRRNSPALAELENKRAKNGDAVD